MKMRSKTIGFSEKNPYFFSRNRFWAPGLVELPGCPPESVDFPPAAKSLFGGKEKSVIFNERNGEVLYDLQVFYQKLLLNQENLVSFKDVFWCLSLKSGRG